MAIELDKINTVPIINQDFPFELMQWMANLVDTLNIILSNIEYSFNLLTVQSLNTTQINYLFTNNYLSNGVLLYDNVLNVYVGMQSGALVKFTTTAYP